MTIAPHDRQPMARALGLLSLGIGAAQEASPDAVARLVGVRGTDGTRALIRGVGARELATGTGILARRRPAGWLWGRVAGDLMDLGLLARALLAERAADRRRRVATTAAALAGLAVVDVVTAARSSRSPADGAGGRDGSGRPRRLTAVVTVNRPPSQVYDAWRDLERLPMFMAHLESVRTSGDRRSHWVAAGPAGRPVEWDAEIVDDVPGERLSWRSLPGSAVSTTGVVRFVPAPREQGTEVRLELQYRAPGGALGSTVAALFGEAPALQVDDDLRRFKQVMETGEVLASEGSPKGTRAADQVRQRPARPPS